MISSMVEKALCSIDAVKRAEPAPFLLTRILGRMQRKKASAWEHVSQILSRPRVALMALSCLLVINFAIFSYDGEAEKTQQQTIPSSNEDFSMNNPVVLFDLENIQP